MTIFSTALDGHHESYLLAQARYRKCKDPLRIAVHCASGSLRKTFFDELLGLNVQLIEPGSFLLRGLNRSGLFGFVYWFLFFCKTAFSYKGPIYVTYVDNLRFICCIPVQIIRGDLSLLHFRLAFPDLPKTSFRSIVEKSAVWIFITFGGKLLTFDPDVVKWVCKVEGESMRKVWLCPDPVRTEAISGRTLVSKKRRWRILIFGSISDRKGIQHVIRAIMGIAPEFQFQIELLIVGPAPTKFENELEAWLGSNGEKRFQVTRLNCWIASDTAQSYFAHVDLVPLFYDGHIGMSSVLVRACAAGAKVVTWNNGLLGRLCRRLPNSYLANRSDDLSIIFTEILTSEDLSEKIIVDVMVFSRFHSEERFAESTVDAVDQRLVADIYI